MFFRVPADMFHRDRKGADFLAAGHFSDNSFAAQKAGLFKDHVTSVRGCDVIGCRPRISKERAGRDHRWQVRGLQARVAGRCVSRNEERRSGTDDRERDQNGQ